MKHCKSIDYKSGQMYLSVYLGAHVPMCAPTSASDKKQGIFIVYVLTLFKMMYRHFMNKAF